MSSSAFTPGPDSALEMVLGGHARDIDGFTVSRILPAISRKHLGPFVFFDHLGPSELAPGRGLDVRPHPHIGLATVTYVLEGEVMHRDSLGFAQAIRPGAVNWMTAGRGIVHSERTAPELRQLGSRLHVAQLWVALPNHMKRLSPSFIIIRSSHCQHSSSMACACACSPGPRTAKLPPFAYFRRSFISRPSSR